MIGIIILIVFIVGIAGAIFWFYKSNKKDKPKEQENPSKPDDNDKPKPLEPDINPHEPDIPIGPDIPDPSTNIEPDDPENPQGNDQDGSDKPLPDQGDDVPGKEDENVDPIFTKEGFEEFVDKFRNIVGISRDSKTYTYLSLLFEEACAQFRGKNELMRLPELYTIHNFPYVISFYGENGADLEGFKALVSWLFALQLSELVPTKRAELMKIGYCTNKYANIYGNKFKSDANVARMVAAAIYAGMRGLYREYPMFNFDDLKDELGGTFLDDDLETIKESNSLEFGEDEFYVDLREFMPSAPGPYAPGYKTRPEKSYPGEDHTSDLNLLVDRQIHEHIIQNYNLDNEENKERVVQAIADKEGDLNHLFGEDRQYKDYKFHAVFGEQTIGKTIDPESALAKLAKLCQYIASYMRDVLQSEDVSPKEYGRLRPGCSWEKEATPHSTTDDRWNVLCDFEIEDNDGCPTGYYDKSGEWVYPDKVKSEKDFVKYYQKKLYANSYPSGHSSSIEGVAMLLIELMPDRADLILRATNDFALSRTIARYHWTSDTINGRVLGSIAGALVHNASDFKERFEEAKKDL